MSELRAFKTVSLGGVPIHRVALAPLTRFRATPNTQLPTNLHTEYYTQRASEGGLLITEATFISRRAAGYSIAPGIYNDEQVAAWKKVTDGVHSKSGHIFSQLWALGRANCNDDIKMDDVPTVGPSAGVGLDDAHPPKELSVEDIKQYIGDYKQAALNAAKAGFDGVEVHGANGYLVDQFLQTNSNKRTDAYGGSIENRSRFLFEAVGAAVEAIGQEKVGLRLSPWGTFQGMGEADPYKEFGFVVKKLTETFPKLAYLHFVEPREWAPGSADRGHLASHIKPSNDRFRALVRGLNPEEIGDDETFVFPEPTAEKPTLFLTAGNFDLENTATHIERTGDVVAVGRYFISNPDLPYRIKNSIPLTKYNRDTFYSPGPVGYVDYPVADELKAEA